MDSFDILPYQDIKITKKYEESLSRIIQHMYNKDFYLRPGYKIIQSKTVSGDFRNKNLRRSYYLNSEIQDSILAGVGCSDSIFYQTNFRLVDFENAGLGNCIFYRCHFIDNEMYQSVNFTSSTFKEVLFRNSKFNQCRMYNCDISESYFENVHFDNTGFENTILRNVSFENCSFKNLNLEFIEFHEVHFHDTALPFASIPYIFNGIRYLVTTSDHVFIKSASKEQRITKDAYLALIPDFICYYINTNNYFPLANIYIGLNRWEDAYHIIESGIEEAIKLSSFRMLKNYCKLLNLTEQFNLEHLKKTYRNICDQINKNIFLTNSIPNLSFNVDEIKKILLERRNSISLGLTFRTNIDNRNYSAISLFYQSIDVIFERLEIPSGYSIQYSYNSEADIFTLVEHLLPQNLVGILTAVHVIFTMGIKAISSLSDMVIKLQNHKQALRKDQYALELKKQEHKHSEELASLKLENEKLILKEKTQQLYAQKLDQLNNTINCLERLNSLLPKISAMQEDFESKKIEIKDFFYTIDNFDNEDLTENILDIVYNTQLNKN